MILISVIIILVLGPMVVLLQFELEWMYDKFNLKKQHKNDYKKQIHVIDIANSHGGRQKASRFSLGVGLEVWEQ